MTSENTDNVRIDKYLWSIRLFKSRSISSEVCRKGWVSSAHGPVKPSKEVQAGEHYSIRYGGITRQIEVIRVIDTRVSASIARECYHDITPKEELQRILMLKEMNYERRDKGSGRPTKKERRNIGRVKDIS